MKGLTAAPRPGHFTPREREVLSLLCEGLPNKLIARRLNIALATVKIHVSNVLQELGVSSRLQAVLVAQHHGISTGAFPGDPVQDPTGCPGPEAYVGRDVNSRQLVA